MPQHLPDLTPFQNDLDPVTFREGEVIFKAGDVGDCCYFLDSGSVRLEAGRDELDTDSVLGYLNEGETLGELALLDSRPRSASAIAHSELKTRRLTRAALEKLSASHPQESLTLYAFLARLTAGRLRATTERLAEAIFERADPEVDQMVAAAQKSHREFASWDEKRVDALLADIAAAAAARSQEMAEAAVKITRMGNVPDKTIKNYLASNGVLHHMRGRVGSGQLSCDPCTGVTEIAAPVGVVFGLVPVTNPVATAVFKTLITLKGRNSLILSFHRTTRELGTAVVDMIRAVLLKHGAPADLVSWVKDRNSRKKTESFFRHPGVAMILATGGPSVVKAAYSSGKPAIGVGAGNAPALVCPDCDLGHAAFCVVVSKSFDNGLICGSEHNLVVVQSVAAAFAEALEKNGAAVLTPAETSAFTANAFTGTPPSLGRKCVGQSAASIAAEYGIVRPYPIRLIVVPASEIHADNPLAREKMAPITSFFTVPDVRSGLDVSLRLLAIEGEGHTAAIHSKDEALIAEFSRLMPASRIIVNSPTTQGVIGFTTGLIPSLTLGCGTYGGTSTTDNVTFSHLLNVKRLARFCPPREHILRTPE